MELAARQSNTTKMLFGLTYAVLVLMCPQAGRLQVFGRVVDDTSNFGTQHRLTRNYVSESKKYIWGDFLITCACENYDPNVSMNAAKFVPINIIVEAKRKRQDVHWGLILHWFAWQTERKPRRRTHCGTALKSQKPYWNHIAMRCYSASCFAQRNAFHCGTFCDVRDDIVVITLG